MILVDSTIVLLGLIVFKDWKIPETQLLFSDFISK